MSKATMALIKHATGSQDDDPGLTAAMNRLGEFVKKWGINKLEDDFKRVVSAASELGKEKAFVSNNKYLSKLAHPTAWVVNSVTSLEADTMVRDQILKDAVLMARQSLLHIRDLVLTTFPKPGHEHELDL
jgi:hypothetical protein